ncbi:hypothetical protein ACUH7Y_25450 [Clostridium beijerinckii]|uniref:Uncharacterized protein n=1 Tax=Clostridium beijerinckii TaxID=1520 RepID=A0A7X9SR88_CLOBE|nr:hypothetical protein [Clostridium beijerinckii]NMF06578.1 hypothetical protein [Clostridium beijerinckii]
MKKLILILLCFLTVFNIAGCKSYYKQEEINYSNLENVMVNTFYKDDKYQNKQAMTVYDKKSGTSFDIIIMDSNGDIKTKTGSKIKLKDYIKINKAEIAPNTPKDKNIKLLVNQSDLESIKEIKLQQLLDSNKTYSELSANKDSSIFTLMMSVEDGDIKYDSKYNDRFEELKKDFEAEKAKLHAEIENTNSNSDNIPKAVTSSYKAKFGQILEANQLNNKLTIKFKITPAATNKQTIDQNGFNVEDLITNQGCDQFDTINYWAVADMADGSESKVISYTINKDIIQQIKNKKLFGQQIFNKAENVWILPTLRK